jgi:toxin YoeB
LPKSGKSKDITKGGIKSDASSASPDVGPRVSVFQPEFREDLLYWVGQDARVAKRILELVEAVMREPFTGIGKPEPLKHLGANTWSRRVTLEHRIVYRVYDDKIDFLQCRLHY